MIFATLIVLFLHSKCKTFRFWKPTVMCCGVIWIGVVLVATIGERTADAVRIAPALIPFHSYIAVIQGQTSEILRSNFMNVLLFYPAGLLFGLVPLEHWKPWKKFLLITAIFVLISIVVEILQYCCFLGMAEIDDVLHNALGAFLGAVVSNIPLKIKGYAD